MTIGRDFAKAIVKEAVNEARLEMGEAAFLKKLVGSNPGDPIKGIAPTFTFTVAPTRAVVTSLNQNDIMYSGGLYQAGDINVQLNEELREISDRAPGVGDRLIWSNSEFRVVGKKDHESITGRHHFFVYIMRKVNT